MSGARGQVRVRAAQPKVPDSPITVRLDASPTGETRSVGPYRVVRTLGHGGMGVVYEVVDDGGVHFALKIVEMRFIQSGDGTAGRRFSQEVSVLRQLAHPGIVRFFAYGYARHPEGTELGFFLMERLIGRTLEELLADGRRFSPLEAVEVVGLLAQALQYLDDSNVLHRDIKPSNLFIEQGGRTVLMDFGLARSEELTRLTRAGQVIGTVSYMSPERLCGLPSTIASDVYSLGVVLYEMLTGRLPFDATDPTTLVREIKRGVVWAPMDHLEGGAELQALVRSMLNSDAKARPRPYDIIKRCMRIRSEEEIVEATVSDDKTMAATFCLAPQAFKAPVIEHDTRPTPSAPISDAVVPPRTGDLATVRGPSWPVAATLMTLTFFGGLLTGLVANQPVEQKRVVTVPTKPPAPPPPVVPKPGAAPIEVVTFEDADAAYAYGDKALDEGRVDDGVRALRRAVELNITHADAYRRLGHGLLTLGKTEEAAKKFDMYLKLRPGAEDAAEVKRLLDAVSGN